MSLRREESHHNANVGKPQGSFSLPTPPLSTVFRPFVRPDTEGPDSPANPPKPHTTPTRRDRTAHRAAGREGAVRAGCRGGVQGPAGRGAGGGARGRGVPARA
ncbi:hypothetical protein GCM10010245_85250 [Streptomyces spectabilis]|nr:hypothetical protein GCM10010245_85250 [Streptomyces spectabilis]